MASSPRPTKALIVHPLTFFQGRIKQLLRAQANCRSATVETGRRVIDLLSAGPFDVVILSEALPDTNGWQVIKLLRSGAFCSATLPIILLCDQDRSGALQPLAKTYGVLLHSDENLDRLPMAVDRSLSDYRSSRPTVLVVEDDDSAAAFATQCLGDEYTVECAADGRTGLDAWRARQHDLVLLDVQLPKLSGFTVHEQIMRAKPEQPVVVITAFATQERHRDFVLGGAASFIAKPIEAQSLRSACRQVLHAHDLQRHRQLADSLDERLQQLEAQVSAASHYIDTGQTAMAAHHLHHSVATSRRRQLSDDDWLRLSEEADGADTERDT